MTERAPETKTAEEAPKTVELRDVLDAAALLDRAAETKESRFTVRAVRALVALRKRGPAGVVAQLAAANAERHAFLKPLAADAMADESSPAVPQLTATGAAAVGLLGAMTLLGAQPCADAAASTAYGVCKSIATEVCPSMDPTLDVFTARVWFYYARAAELRNGLTNQEVRARLMLAHRDAGLRRMEETRATLVNALLRSYLSENLVDQADMLASKAPVHEQATPGQLARFFYYRGRIYAVQLEYSSAHEALQQALRKAPQTGALGFRVAATVLLITVELLMGDIPERSVFVQKGMRRALAPYLRLAQAVRVGDVCAFRDEVAKDQQVFARDGTLSLVSRLRHNVIKTALRAISLTYSRISLADVAQRLHIEADDCEFVVAKAIRDGVIDAVIDHDGGFVRSKENADVYATQEPQAAFDRRTRFCLRLHNDAMRAMRYAPDAHRKGLTANEESRLNEEELERLQREAEEDDGSDEDDDFDM